MIYLITEVTWKITMNTTLKIGSVIYYEIKRNEQNRTHRNEEAVGRTVQQF